MKKLISLTITLFALTFFAQNSFAQNDSESASNDNIEQEDTESINDGITDHDEIIMDSIYHSPILISWFDTPTSFRLKNGNELTINVAEITDLYSGEKLHKLHLNINFSAGLLSKHTIEMFVSYEKIVSIINALNGISDYISNNLSSVSEDIIYNINLTQDIAFETKLSYSPENNNWECRLEFCTPDAIRTASNNYSTPTNGFSLYGYLNNTQLELPNLIAILEERLLTLKNRMEEPKNDIDSLKLAHNEDGSITCTYATDTFPSAKITDISNIMRVYKLNDYIDDINRKLNKVLLAEIPNFKDLGNYGYISCVIGSGGKILGRKLILSDTAFQKLNKRTIILLLNTIDTIINKSKIDYTKVPSGYVHSNVVTNIPLNTSK